VLTVAAELLETISLYPYLAKVVQSLAKFREPFLLARIEHLSKSGIANAFQSTAFYGGIFLMVTCVGLIVTYIGELISGTTKHGVASQLGLITFLAGLVFVGARLMQGRLKERRALQQIKEEQSILSRAKLNGGSLTISEAALECGIGISDAKNAFERLSKTGACQVDVTPQGELYYRFPTFNTKQIESEIHPGEFG